MRSRRRSFSLLLAFGLAVAGAAHAAVYDWNSWADLETVEVISTDEDGGARLTTVWIVVLDHFPYVRTAGTTWGDNVEREGTLKLRSELGELSLRAERVLDEAEVERVVNAFREKYGTTDRLMEWFRFGERRVFRLVQ
jgi:hypothetical protein